MLSWLRSIWKKKKQFQRGHALLCSNCFENHGLRLDAQGIGWTSGAQCPNCGSRRGAKLDCDGIWRLSHQFFVLGTTLFLDYGAAPVIEINEDNKDGVEPLPWLRSDMELIQTKAGVHFFYYGPNLWMVGEADAVKEFIEEDTRQEAIENLFKKYRQSVVTRGSLFYRLRINPHNSLSPSEYDSPPDKLLGNGRFDASDFPIMYASPDLEVCVHECRTKSDDDAYVAILSAHRDLKLLDLTELLVEEKSSFESLSLAVHMLFLAGQNSYEVARAIARSAYERGYDGLIYPSYFSFVRTGTTPLETVYGISLRQIAPFHKYEQSKIVPNYAIFGRPLNAGLLEIKAINRLRIRHVKYNLSFGPVGFVPESSLSEDFE